MLVAADPECRARFEREAQTIAALNHPNIVTIYSVEEAEDLLFLTMEYVDGKPLSDLTVKGGLPLPQILTLAIPLADAISAAHQRGITHRDLKPANVMVSTDSRVKVLDFGLAKLRETSPLEVGVIGLPTSPLTGEGRIVGTVAYMSPEQAQGKPLDSRSDIFSLGIMLYEMATGEHPFTGETSLAVLSAIVKDTPRSVTDLNPAIPQELARVVNRCLAKEIGRRYQTVVDLRNELEELSAELESGALSPTPTAASIDQVLTDRRAAVSESASGTAPRSAAAAATPPTSQPWHRSTPKLVLAACLVGAMLLLGIGIGDWRHDLLLSGRQPTISSVAVLPLENLSGDPSQEYFSESLTDELITDLARLPGLRVISRTSTTQYRRTNKSLPQIARELNVDAVVEGSVVQTESRVRIRIQLVEARRDRHVWAEAYERDMRDVLGLQSDVARAITHQINLELTPQLKARFSRDQPRNFQAYAAYLKGRYEWNKRTKESLKQSIQYFEEAITEDSAYALAHEGLAETYGVMNTYGVLPPEEAYPKAKAEALRALELDDELGEAHAILAELRKTEGDWRGAEREFLRALELSPSYATAHQWYGEYLLNTGRFDQGLAEMQRGHELDPGSPLMNGVLGMASYEARRYGEAIQQLRKAIEMEPRFAWSHAWLGFAFAQERMHQEAIQEFQKAVDLSGGSPDFTAFLGYAYGLSGDRRQAQTIAEKLVILSHSKTPYVSPLFIALVYTSLNEKDQAFQWLEKGYAAHDVFLQWLKVEPSLDTLRSDVRFQNLIRQMGFP
jgi:serine/threonine-protein kinase